jgi:hypothetical protein
VWPVFFFSRCRVPHLPPRSIIHLPSHLTLLWTIVPLFFGCFLCW